LRFRPAEGVATFAAAAAAAAVVAKASTALVAATPAATGRLPVAVVVKADITEVATAAAFTVAVATVCKRAFSAEKLFGRYNQHQVVGILRQLILKIGVFYIL
jgi:hypothetical protein